MIICFKVKYNKKLDNVIKILEQRYKIPNNPMEVAKQPYSNTLIKLKKNILIIRVNIVYKYLNPIMYLLTLPIDNKWLFYIAIRQVFKKNGFKDYKLLSNKKTIEELI